jgi:hypothetical protein
VATAAPTPYVHEVVTACQNSGRSVSIVSNNSARAVHAYLARHGLDDRISLVVARTSHDPALLKPSPHLITQAVEALDAEPGECTLVGDSVTDVQGARLASVQSVGYANKPGKPERLSKAGAGAIVNSLADLTLKFRARIVDPVSIRSCDKFLYGFFSRAPLRRASAGPVARTRVGTQSHRRECVIEAATTRTRRGGGGPVGRLRGSGHAAPSRAVALTGAPPPPGQQARSRRSAVPAVTLRQWPRLQGPGLGRH